MLSLDDSITWTSDAVVTLYIDGTETANSSSGVVTSATLLERTRFVAFRIRDGGGNSSGVIASMGSGVVTDGLWHCTRSSNASLTECKGRFHL